MRATIQIPNQDHTIVGSHSSVYFQLHVFSQSVVSSLVFKSGQVTSSQVKSSQAGIRAVRHPLATVTAASAASRISYLSLSMARQ